MPKRTSLGVFLTGVACLLPATAVQGAENERASERTKVIILVGGHGYDARGFGELWSSFDDIASEVWKGDPYTAFDDISDFKYDVIVMFNLSSGITGPQKENFLKLLDKGVGLVVWHHALANCQGWPEFEKIAGGKFWMNPGQRGGAQIPKSGTGFGMVKLHIEDPDHAITKGMSDFVIEDEPYNGQTFRDDIHVLVTADHPRSDKQIAWVHNHGKARVFGYQSGHDARAWTNKSFQRLMAQGIRWVAGRLSDD
ncbi:MAG: ThuA domain-containing protein [Planctomycetes bacterium]|nr:ThuA domain-containing protein [Planctomycetota bacterium]